MIDIRISTTNDAVRTALAHFDDDDSSEAATFSSLPYNSCLRDAYCSCKNTQYESPDAEVEQLCKLEMLVHLQFCLTNEPFWTEEDGAQVFLKNNKNIENG